MLAKDLSAKKGRLDLSGTDLSLQDLAEKIQSAWQPPSADCALTQAHCQDLAHYLTLLNHWNRVHSLTAIEEIDQQIRRHLIDGLSVWPEIIKKFGPNPEIHIADVGSGMGVPGVVWAIVMPSARLDLIERQQKKAAFLRHVAGRLGLSGRLRVVAQDVRAHRAEPRYDLITSRAFAALPDFLSVTQAIAGPETRWAAMVGRLKAEVSEQKLIKINSKSGGFVVDEIIPIAVPGLSEQRHLIWARAAE